MPNHDLVEYVSKDVKGYAARGWIESLQRACAGHGSLVLHVWQLDCCAACVGEEEYLQKLQMFCSQKSENSKRGCVSKRDV